MNLVDFSFSILLLKKFTVYVRVCVCVSHMLALARTLVGSCAEMIK